MKRTICIQNPANLSTASSSLLVSQDGRKTSVPLEEIWVLILETHQANITVAALSRLVDEGIGVMMCGKNHMPNGLLLPLGAHSRHAEIVEDQLAISRPLKKQLWKRIVEAKIRNQARVLQIIGNESGYKKLMKCSTEVLSGDTSGREAVAASIYFRELLPVGGRRSGPYGAALDYGYTVLRAGIGRTAVAGGWLVSQGLHHCSNLNAFNLVDDLIEPFRSVVDLLVVQHDLQGELTKEMKRDLASVFEYLVLLSNQKYLVQSAIETTFDSLREAVLASDASLLKLPQVIPLELPIQE